MMMIIMVMMAYMMVTMMVMMVMMRIVMMAKELTCVSRGSMGEDGVAKPQKLIRCIVLYQ